MQETRILHRLGRLTASLRGRARSAAPIAAGASGAVMPPTVAWPDPARPVHLAMPCPNCGNRAPKRMRLTVSFITPDHPRRDSRVAACPDCTCLFFEDQNPPDYTEEAMLGRGRTAFYIQQGAGVSLITRPLARLRHPPGSHYLEVGCGFGFGLDFALKARGWTGVGIDPAGISSLGARLLDVPIEQRYLRDDEPRFAGTCDVVMASETIEHVPSPAAFIATLRRALKPGGVLVLTTPNADEIEPSRSKGLLVPLLSPGLHLVLQTPRSLRRLLEESGFRHIVQETDSVSLVFFASDAPFALEDDPAALRGIFRRHLEDRARACPAAEDLFLGFAGRALFECANDADWDGVDRAMALLRPACRDRFGIDVETLAALPDGAARMPLERLAEAMPINLGNILYGVAMRALSTDGTARPRLGPRLALAADAADAVRRALGELAMEDGLSEAIGWAARAEAAICDAAAGLPDAAVRLAALPPAPPGGASGAARRQEAIQQSLAWAVNAGHLDLGAAIGAALKPEPWLDPPSSEITPPPLPASQRDTLFCLAVMDARLDGAGDPKRARRRFAHLRRILQAHGLDGADPALPAQVVRGELQALEVLGDDEGQRDVIVETLEWVAHLVRDEEGELRSRLASLDRAQLDRTLSHLVALTNAADYEAASAVADRVAGEPFVASPGGAALTTIERDALFALAVLALHARGDAEAARDRFARVREAAMPLPGAPASPLLWAAIRGETEALLRLGGLEAAALHVAALRKSVPTSAGAWPDDLLEISDAVLPAA